jgi:hypothetical protein
VRPRQAQQQDEGPFSEKELEAAETREALARERTSPRLSRPDVRQNLVEGMRQRFSPHDASEFLFSQLTHEGGLAMTERAKPFEDGAPIARRVSEMGDDPGMRTVPDVGEALLAETRKQSPDRVEVAALAERMNNLLLEMNEGGAARRNAAEAGVRKLSESELEARIERAATLAGRNPSIADWQNRNVAFIGFEGGRLTPGKETMEAMASYAVFGAANVNERSIRGTSRPLGPEMQREVAEKAAGMTHEQRLESYWRERLTAQLLPQRGTLERADAWANAIEDIEAQTPRKRGS